MKEAAPQTIRLEDYQPLPYKIEEIHLTFDLHSTQTKVTSKMKVIKNPKSKDDVTPINLPPTPKTASSASPAGILTSKSIANLFPVLNTPPILTKLSPSKSSFNGVVYPIDI